MLELLRRLWFLFHRAKLERDLEEEMSFHLALLEEDGKEPSAARRQFGNVTLLKEESRSMWTFVFLEQLAQDLRMPCALWPRARSSRPLPWGHWRSA
jgi:hypothetical protein